VRLFPRPRPRPHSPRSILSMNHSRNRPLLIHRLPVFLVQVLSRQNHIRQIALALDPSRNPTLHLPIGHAGSLRMLVVVSSPILGRMRSAPPMRSELVHNRDLALRIGRICRSSISFVESVDELPNRRCHIFARCCNRSRNTKYSPSKQARSFSLFVPLTNPNLVKFL